ncbi:MAG TPA: hypothetical protein VFD70_05705 [Anaerolineae bacterium]|nr:hypothetical protein [Anaerolineae bacterium]
MSAEQRIHFDSLTESEKIRLAEGILRYLKEDVPLIKELQAMSNAELADLLLNRVWAYIPVTNPLSYLLDEVMERLDPDSREESLGEANQGVAEKPITDLESLMSKFAAALLEKAKAAETKYGYLPNSWMNDDWADMLPMRLMEHIAKGDPRDVAIFCAFAWYHGWSVASDATYAQQIVSFEGQLAAAKQRAQQAEKLLAEIAPQFLKGFLYQPHIMGMDDWAMKAREQQDKVKEEFDSAKEKARAYLDTLAEARGEGQ